MVGVAAVTVLAGCGSSQDGAVEDAAEEFYAALAARDGERACALLAPSTRSELEQAAQKPCPRAILEERIPEASSPEAVEVFGRAGEVRYDDEVAFLGEFPDGWRIVAAGCTPRDPHPYDCHVAGG
ncbi:hypothetical protein F0U47_19805 [Nocardioides antri]|uniref:Uncharacterized protein n=1 Tax=Nocardioides antri TaxID=2607659 RepID=A0A5B1LTV7_9ACTN|nr:hypothetical protein F0U47_19805 [Nocardioides antri]